MAKDGKYGEVTFEHGNIGETEPVFVIRAQDRNAVPVLQCMWQYCKDGGSPDRHLAMIDEAIGVFEGWQESHPVKTPDSESSREWLGDEIR
jgi:hypothetical protein